MLYLADSLERTIWAYDYDPDGPLRHKRVFGKTHAFDSGPPTVPRMTGRSGSRGCPRRGVCLICLTAASAPSWKLSTNRSMFAWMSQTHVAQRRGPTGIIRRCAP
ncbi:hypothetical protein [Variovorax paradoxus]|uniref:hypothetical protein n=1 Tax=Variovorax paradoxus TaxID=34073 RepID=UPI0027D83E6D|nr:hypothetical protein [Variovorax paradoxus]